MPKINGTSLLEHGDFPCLNQANLIHIWSRFIDIPASTDCAETDTTDWEAAWIDLGGEG
jgi:hypothetical protein